MKLAIATERLTRRSSAGCRCVHPSNLAQRILEFDLALISDCNNRSGWGCSLEQDAGVHLAPKQFIGAAVELLLGAMDCRDHPRYHSLVDCWMTELCTETFFSTTPTGVIII